MLNIVFGFCRMNNELMCRSSVYCFSYAIRASNLFCAAVSFFGAFFFFMTGGLQRAFGINLVGEAIQGLRFPGPSFVFLRARTTNHFLVLILLVNCCFRVDTSLSPAPIGFQIIPFCSALIVDCLGSFE